MGTILFLILVLTIVLMILWVMGKSSMYEKREVQKVHAIARRESQFSFPQALEYCKGEYVCVKETCKIYGREDC
jgi:hypothetical protein